jgi:hypothetical protein
VARFPGTFTASGQVTLSYGSVKAFTEQFKIASAQAHLLGQATSPMAGGPGFCVPDIGLANVVLAYHVTITLTKGSHSQASGKARATVSGGASAPSQLLQNFSNRH